MKNKNAVNDERIYKNQLSVIVDCHYSLLGVCMVRLVQFFLKFITEPIEIGIYIIGTDAHRLKSIFWLIAVWSNKKNKKIKLRLSHCIKIPFPFRYYMCLFFKKEKEKKKRDCKSIIIIISKKYCFFFLKNKNAVNDERIYKNQL